VVDFNLAFLSVHPRM